MVINGIRRHHTTHRTRNPITYSLLKHILKYFLEDYPSNSHNRRMLSAATSLTFYALLRVSEFTAPTRYTFSPHRTLLTGDVQILNHSISLRVRASKTDQKQRGQTVLIGCTRASACPVDLLASYIMHARQLPRTAPLFQWKDGTYLTPSKFTTVLKQALTAVGANQRHFSTHSLRIGGATAAATAGIEPSIIQELGRWRSQCFRRYTRAPNSRLLSAAEAMSNHRKASKKPGTSR